MTINPKNERIKHRYFVWLKEAKQQHETTIDKIAQSIAHYEVDTRFKDFYRLRS